MKHNEQANHERDDHALLTASIFGELSADEQAALDARLANEPELRAQRDALAATASLVRGSFPAGESLPPELLAGLERAAAGNTPAPAPIHQMPTRTNWMRIAAGLTLICGGAIAANELFKSGDREDTREDRLAQGERLYGYNEAASNSRSRPITEIDAEGATRIKRENYFDAEDPEQYEQLRKKLGEVAATLEADQAPAEAGLDSIRHSAGPSQDLAGERLGGTAGQPKDSAQYDMPGRQLGRTGAVEAPEAETASDDAFFIGQAQADNSDRFGKRGAAPAPATVEPLDRPGSSHGGHYRGPGDAVPPSGGGGEASPGSGVFPGAELVTESPAADPAVSAGMKPQTATGNGGPSSPSPAGPSTPAPAREVKRVKSKSNGPHNPGPNPTPEAKVHDSLRGLGYVGGDEDGEAADSGRFRRALDGHEESEVIELDDLDRWQEVSKRKKLRFEDDGDELDFDVEYDREGRKRDYAGRRIYTEDELDALAAQRSERVLKSCRRLPNERPNMMFFRFYGDNGFELAHIDPQSTFGADVDTASYTLARRYLRDGLLPEKAQIRTEEFVNYFKPDLAPPAADSPIPFAVHTELGVSRYGRDQWASDKSAGTERYMLRVGVRGKEVAREERQPLQLTFVVDTSGSMKEGGRMELVKHALRLLITELDARDSIALVAFSNEARQILPMTSAANRGLIETAIHGLNPDGGTNAEAGLRMGYETAGLTLAPGNHSRVVLLSDGVANIGQTDQDRVNEDVRKQRERGIYLNTVGVGMGNHNDVFLEQLANKGDGLCNYVDDEREARRALVENFTGAFETIARDLKVQVEFDASQVYRYRLLGYENRAIADVDFRNDKVDAGEVGAGHQVVALYELELTGNASEAPLAKVNVRWKAPTGAGRHPEEDVAAGEFSFPVTNAPLGAFEATSLGFQRDACVAQFAEIMRRSVHARGDSLDDLIAQSAKLDAQLRDPDFSEFVDMLRASRRLIIEREPRTSDLTDCIDALRRNRILRAQVEELRRDQSAALLSDLEQQNAQLELRIRDLIRQELEQELK
jgi:Mg-chelatase subunit ChlD